MVSVRQDEKPLCPKCHGPAQLQWWNKRWKCTKCGHFFYDEMPVDEVVIPKELAAIDTFTKDGTTYVVQYVCDLGEPEPEREFNVAWANFFKWKHRDLIRKEKRWGRDYLRKQRDC